ncbi:MAG: chorismate lyase [Pseudomonadales bacterium]|jgi:chorismate--pyruvate lyase|nr:chorismate lyase [Pseudomonadales bacterium]
MDILSNPNNPLQLSMAPFELHSWITDNGSLTQKLVAASDGEFEVRVLQEKWQVVRDAEERKLLGLDSDDEALVREVALCCFGSPWVYARSVLPATTLVGPEKQLQFLDNKPLGALLFTHPDMRRGSIHLSRLSAEIVNQRLGAAFCEGLTEPVWGRASLFFLSDKPLLVSEYFLPVVYRTLSRP